MSYIEKRADELRDKFCPPGDYDYSDIFDAIIASLTPPEGYVLVPLVPTLAMIGKGIACRREDGSSSDIYRAMIAARPEVK